jgi:hypothetical protein
LLLKPRPGRGEDRAARLDQVADLGGDLLDPDRAGQEGDLAAVRLAGLGQPLRVLPASDGGGKVGVERSASSGRPR